MIDPKKQAELDQQQMFMVDFYPALWRKLYLRLMSEGFDDSQALDLVKTYIVATFTNLRD